MASANKKAIIRTHDQTVLAGYVSGARLLDAGRCSLELLDTAGRTVSMPLGTVRYVAYVRDFNLNDQENPERLTRRSFLARPRTEGLWLRLTFRDGEVLEGLAPLDSSLWDDAIADAGVFLIPPDVRSNTQRMFVPREALSAMQVLGVITNPSKVAAAPTGKKRHEGELDLPFPEPGPR